MEAIKQYVDLADKIMWRIGYKNIAVGGLVGTACLALYYH
jgi:hypothetical protein